MVEWGWVGVGTVGAGDHLEGLDSAQGQACAVGARGWGRSGAGRGEMTCTNPPRARPPQMDPVDLLAAVQQGAGLPGRGAR